MMFIIHIILAVLAYCPIIALAAPTASPTAEGIQFTPPKNLASEITPAKKLYTGPWSSFPAVSKWIAFDTMVGSFRQTHPSSGSSFPYVDEKPATCPLGSWMGLLTHIVLEQFNANTLSMIAAGSTQQDGK